MVQKNQKTPLPADFTPGPYDVICAKGKVATYHSGNEFYRNLIQQALPQYRNAGTKYAKTVIVSQIVDEVRLRSNGGGFVKQKNGMWHEVGDHIAREKTGQAFRDALSGQYKSSAKAKKCRQKMVSVGVANQFDTLLQRNSFLSRRVHKLTATAVESLHHHQDGTVSSDEDDAELDQIFSQTNLEILEAFKKDDDLLQQFNESEVVYKRRNFVHGVYQSIP